MKGDGVNDDTMKGMRC